MFVSQVRCANAGASAGLLDTMDWDGPDGLLNSLNKQQRYSETPVIHHFNTSEAQKREALATRRAVDSESTDGGEEVVGGSMARARPRTESKSAFMRLMVSRS